VALIGITRNCKLLQTTQFGKVIDSRVHCSKDRTRALEARLLLWHSYVFPVSEAVTIVARSNRACGNSRLQRVRYFCRVTRQILEAVTEGSAEVRGALSPDIGRISGLNRQRIRNYAFF